MFSFGLNTFKSFLCYLKDSLITVLRDCEFIFVSSIMHILLKAYLSFRSKLIKLDVYTFSCTPPTSLAIKIKKKNYMCVFNIFFIHKFILKISGSIDPCL